MKRIRKNNSLMRNGYISAILTTVLFVLALYAIINITLKVKSWFDRK